MRMEHDPEEQDGLIVRDREGGFHSRLVPLLVLMAVLGALVLIPLKVTSYGFLPSDDALRHAGKVIAEKPWSEILVLREKGYVDMHQGWHDYLGWIHRLAGGDVDTLVTFSVIFSFLLFALPPLFMARRPEAWPLALLILALSGEFSGRLFLGRPFLAHIAALLAILLTWEKTDERRTHWGVLAYLTFMVFLSLAFRLLWFLYLFPIACFFLARRWRAGARLLGCLAVASLASFLLFPEVFSLREHYDLVQDALTSVSAVWQLVTELLPGSGSYTFLLLIALLLFWRRLRGKPVLPAVDNPVFILFAVSWLAGLHSLRWWIDFGLPTAAVWIASEFSDALDAWPIVGWRDVRRLALVLFICAATFLAFTTDQDARYTGSLLQEYADADDPAIREWMPEAGGTVFNIDMRVFYHYFYKYPHAPWRYMLGFEPALMPSEDLKIFRHVQWNRGAMEALEKWVPRMTPKDRMWLVRPVGAAAPSVQGLEWKKIASDLWSGRLPRTAQAPSAATPK